MNLERTVLEKIKFQWKTLKKAFSDLNQEKTGAIKPKEFREHLEHWGLTLTDDQFQGLFEKFDCDKDGKISYEDFMNSAGNEINPMEFLYFRQDIDKAPRKTTCKHKECWSSPSGYSDYCMVHVKIFKEKGTALLSKIASNVGGSNWSSFISRITKESE